MVSHLVEDSLKTILYADDIALIADTKDEPHVKVQEWQRTLPENGPRLNVKITKFLSSEDGSEPMVDCYQEVVERVDHFRYLGIKLAKYGTLDQAVKERIDAAWVKWREFTGILCDKRCSRFSKERYTGQLQDRC
ncbi:unnamed protein product [Nippostrongylus brasiliensis]|uniref:Reverse transcriptase domain-containing protein n=1 Tax=Nippostrongylus brasiliensis TaxID=27835 RepID=A0A0N4YEW1_NIPBR|nr:unnamed protein product [Nippostrongylus brasiliensis]